MMDGASMWVILWTGAGRTLPLIQSLERAGYAVWTPTRTVRRPAPGSRRQYAMGQRRVMREVVLPIVPGLVFAREHHLDDLTRIASLPIKPHPAFSIFTWGGRAPLIPEQQILGLRDEHYRAEVAIQAERDIESREIARQERASRLGSERARRKALRQERRDFEPGQAVTVADMPAFGGSFGTVVSSTSTSATIDFGGSLIVKVEAWRVLPAGVQNGNTAIGAAA
jgi:hypothetical protein